MNVHAAYSMGDDLGEDRIRYLRFLYGRWRWRPEKAMRAAGFELVNLSPGLVINGKHVPSAEDKAKAVRLNEAWDRARRGLPELPVLAKKYPRGSIGKAYQRIMRLRAADRAAKGIGWTREQESRDDWPRMWRWVEPLFGDCDPKTVTPEQIFGLASNNKPIGLRPLVATKVSVSEAHRVIKTWRALWKKMALLGYCDRERDPSLVSPNTAPQPRQALWKEGEVVRLIKRAWREDYRGLAAILAVAWDSAMSPIDTRSLRAHQQRRDSAGMWFDVPRAKTGRDAIATLSRRAEWVVTSYLKALPAQPVGLAPLFRTREGAPYRKDTVSADFREIRTMVFGASETRKLADFRRSGSVEALAGDALPEKLSSKMANSLSTSNKLHKTYAPVQLANVREVDAARRRGRTKLREQKPTESVMTPDSECHNDVQGIAKPLK